MSDHRSRPRRRGVTLDDAIIAAAIAELSEVGYAGMTIESVARRAGAGKVSVYRRWPGRLELAMEAAYRLVGEPELPPEPSTLRDDLGAWLGSMVAQMNGPVGEAMRGIVAESLTHAGTATIADLSRGHGVAVLRLVLDRARARGERVRDDLSRVQEQAPAALLQHHFLTHHGVDDVFLDELVDGFVLPLVVEAG